LQQQGERDNRALPFFASYGFHPRSGIEPPAPIEGPSRHRIERQSADDIAQRWERLREFLIEQTTWAKERQAYFANKSRQQHVRFAKDDEIMLDGRFIRTTRPSKKLDQKFLGPFKVTRIVHDGKAYEFNLNKDFEGVHPVFHPRVLHKYERNPYRGQHTSPQPAILIEREGFEEPVEEWEVEEFQGSRMHGRRYKVLQYLVKWAGESNPSWEKANNLIPGAEACVTAFHRLNPQAPGPPKGFTLTRKEWEH